MKLKIKSISIIFVMVIILIASSFYMIQDSSHSLRHKKHFIDRINQKQSKNGFYFNPKGKTDRDMHAFNVKRSHEIGITRNITDTRNKLCLKKQYELPQFSLVSIIICFYNEDFITLLRSIHSVIDRTPSQILKEIIIIDDNSSIANLKEELDTYILYNWSTIVRLIHLKNRHGLIKARMVGARLATAEILVFLDSHVEANNDWLLPLVDHIIKDRKSVAVPYIDLIEPDTFEYISSPRVRGGFNWGLNFRWDRLPVIINNHQLIEPTKTATLSGGLFAINKEYFFEIGAYDEGMEIWGAENLEMSFRTWQCGGSMYILPCSRIGHVFRNRRPYGDGKLRKVNSLIHNQLRLAHVWLDSYKENYFKIKPAVRLMKFGDVNDRIELRKKLNCKSFKWYLTNIYPDLLTIPPTLPSNRIYNYVGKLKHLESGLCIRPKQDIYTKKSLLILDTCSDEMVWYLTKENRLQLAKILCLTIYNNNIVIMKCDFNEFSDQQIWIYNKNKLLVNKLTKRNCLDVKKRGLKYYITNSNICQSHFKFT